MQYQDGLAEPGLELNLSTKYQTMNMTCTHILSVVLTTSEGNIWLHVDNDGEVEDDETDHQVLVDGESRTTQRTEDGK